MVASDEWEVLYLTENGWVTGGYKLDCGEIKEDSRPKGAVLEVRRHAVLGKLGVPSSMHSDESRSNLIQDKDKIKSLLSKFGEPKFSV